MKDLSNFDAVKAALEQVVAQSDVNNGTQGIELLAHYWTYDHMFDKRKAELQTDVARAVLAGNLDVVKLKQTELEGLPKSKIVMEWRLLTPIPRLTGTKIVTDGDKTYKLSMDNVTTLYIPEDAVKLGLLEYEETEDKAHDMMGKETSIVKLHLKQGIIDIAPPVLGRGDKELRGKRAFVTAISYRAMQTVGEILNRERNAKRKRYGFDEQA